MPAPAERTSREPFAGDGARIRLSNAVGRARIPPRLLEPLARVLPTARAEAWLRFVREHAALRAEGRRVVAATPILMYHAFGRGQEPASRFVLPLRRLRRQVLLLRLLRYRAVDLPRLAELAGEGRAPSRTVAITIDDCYAETATALEILRRHGFRATVFAVSGLVGEANRWDAGGELEGRRLLSWSELESLPPEVDLGAHTRTHPRLTGLHPEAVRAEVAGSRADLERRLGRRISSFAYPHGEHDEVSRRIVAEAGFACACSAGEGLNTLGTDPFLLRRIDVAGTDSLPVFAAKLWLGRRRLRR